MKQDKHQIQEMEDNQLKLSQHPMLQSMLFHEVNPHPKSKFPLLENLHQLGESRQKDQDLRFQIQRGFSLHKEGFLAHLLQI